MVGDSPLGAQQPVPSTSDAAKPIRIRNLMTHLHGGGRVTAARLVEREDDRWMIFLGLADRPGEHRVNVWKHDRPKTYVDLKLAVETVRSMFGYAGPITLVTTKPASGRTKPPRVAEEGD